MVGQSDWSELDQGFSSDDEELISAFGVEPAKARASPLKSQEAKSLSNTSMNANTGFFTQNTDPEFYPKKSVKSGNNSGINVQPRSTAQNPFELTSGL